MAVLLEQVMQIGDGEQFTSSRTVGGRLYERKAAGGYDVRKGIRPEHVPARLTPPLISNSSEFLIGSPLRTCVPR
ncbi:hypothetical protein M404DRAFT_996908, partial [Pisolithus tinctorius Marx 270]